MDKNTLTFEMLLEKYFYAKTLRDDTQGSYRKVVRTFISFADVYPNDVDDMLVLKWKNHVLNECKCQITTWNNKVTHMRALFNFALKKGLFTGAENPFNGVIASPNVKRKKTLSDSQIEKIYCIMQQYIGLESEGVLYSSSRNALYPAWFWMVVLNTLRYTAIRRNQLLHIRLSDIDFSGDCIQLRVEGAKNHREHQVPIVTPLRTSLQELVLRAKEAGVKPQEQLFNVARFDGRRRNRYALEMTESPLRTFFRRLSRECNFTVSPHRFRHTVATKLMRSPDRNLQTVKTLLGHVSLTSTLEYVEVNIESMKETLENELRWY